MQPYITIIGAGPGISNSVAQLFGQKGFAVALVARNATKLAEQTDHLKELGIKTMYATADVANEQMLNTALDTIENAWGTAEMTLYNASAYVIKDILEQDWQQLMDCFAVNAAGAFFTGKRVLPQYLAADRGKLFFTGGGSALKGDPQWAALGLGKAGMRYLVQAFAQKAAGSSVHVAQLMILGAVNPGHEKYNPDSIAEQYWLLFQEQAGNYQEEILY